MELCSPDLPCTAASGAVSQAANLHCESARALWPDFPAQPKLVLHAAAEPCKMPFVA